MAILQFGKKKGNSEGTMRKAKAELLVFLLLLVPELGQWQPWLEGLFISSINLSYASPASSISIEIGEVWMVLKDKLQKNYGDDDDEHDWHLFRAHHSPGAVLS